VELDGRPIKEGEVITARPGSESKLPVLANLCSKEARRSLFTMSEPEPPTDRSASLIIWTASPNSSSLGGANQYELKERLRSLGYVDY